MKKTTTLFRMMFAIAALSIMFIACEKKISVTGVALDKSSAVMYVGDNLTLWATVLPNSATNKTINWSSSNISIAEVNKGTTENQGVVSAKSLGETVITVTTRDGSHSATCDVIVTMPPAGHGCSSDVPGFGPSLGVVNFVTDSVWVVGDQIWSDAVQATVCRQIKVH